MKKKLFALSLLAVLSVSLFAQNKGVVEFKLSLRDGSVISGTTSITSVDLITDYGKLVFPMKNLSSITFGIQPDKANKEKYRKQLNELNNPSENDRKKAFADISNSGISAIPVLEELLLDSAYVPSIFPEYIGENALSELKLKYNIVDAYTADDIITIDNLYKMGGICSVKNVSLKTEYGTLEIPKDKIKTIDVFYQSDSQNEVNYVLLASKHISGNTAGGYLKTGIYVKAGQKINITATGEITLASLSNAKYKPEGAVTSANYDYDGGDYSYASTYPTYGNVIFKVGENGQMIKAGSNYKGVMTISGYIYLSIYETVYNAANTGSYNVKIKTY
jgi:hypothetical protein